MIWCFKLANIFWVQWFSVSYLTISIINYRRKLRFGDSTIVSRDSTIYTISYRRKFRGLILLLVTHWREGGRAHRCKRKLMWPVFIDGDCCQQKVQIFTTEIWLKISPRIGFLRYAVLFPISIERPQEQPLIMVLVSSFCISYFTYP